MDIRLDTTDVQSLIKDLNRYAESLDDLKGVHLEAALVVEREAERRVPVDTGALISSIRSAAQKKSGVIRAGYASIPYAPVQEYGWPKHGIKAHLYMHGAKDDKMQVIIQIYDQGVGDLAKKIIG